MSDSDCSNCDKECKFGIEDHYNCYVNEVKEIKEKFNDSDIKLFSKTNELLKKKNDDLYNDTIRTTIQCIDELIGMYGETL